MNSTNELIKNLTDDLNPIQPLPSVRNRQWILWIIGLSVTACIFSYWSIRLNEYSLPAGRSLLEVLLLLLTCKISGDLALKSTSPHTAKYSIAKNSWYALLSWLVLLLVTFGIFYFKDPHSSLEALNYNTWMCPKLMLSIALPLSWVFFFFLKQGAILFPSTTALYLSQTSAAFGAIGLAFICPWRDPLHELLWHVVPSFMIILICNFLFIFAYRFLQKKVDKNYL